MEHLRAMLNRDIVADILESAGYELDRQYKFKLREERTPSAVLNADGWVHDYGSGFHGDVFKVLQSRGMNFPDAKKIVMDCLGINSESSIETHFIPIKRKYIMDELTDKRYGEIVSFVGKCDRSQCQTFRDMGYKVSALSIAPFWLFKDATKESIERFKKFTTYDESQKSIVLKICDYTQKLISYKHRYFEYTKKEKMKWYTAKKTHPNKQCMVSVKGNELFPIYVVEGARDFLVMVCLGMRVVAIPTINYKEWNNIELSILKDNNVVFVPDVDPNLNGVETMEALAEQISDVATSINIIDCRKIAKFQDIAITDKKIDLSDIVYMWDESMKSFSPDKNESKKKTIYAFLSALLYVSDLGVMLPEGEVF